MIGFSYSSISFSIGRLAEAASIGRYHIDIDKLRVQYLKIWLEDDMILDIIGS